MNLSTLRGSAAIAGVATFGCGEAPGFSEMELLARSAHAAVADAGLKMSDIDGLCTASVGSTMWSMPVVEYLGIRPTFIDSTMVGGSSFIAHLLPAMHALQSCQCNAVLVCYGSTQRTSTFGRREIAQARRWMDPQPYETPYAPWPPRATCTSTAPPAAIWPKWPWPHANGRNSIPKPLCVIL